MNLLNRSLDLQIFLSIGNKKIFIHDFLPEKILINDFLSSPFGNLQSPWSQAVQSFESESTVYKYDSMQII